MASQHPAMRPNRWRDPTQFCDRGVAPLPEAPRDDALILGIGRARRVNPRKRSKVRGQYADTLVLYARGYSYKAIAWLLDIDESTVRQRVSDGLKALDEPVPVQPPGYAHRLAQGA